MSSRVWMLVAAIVAPATAAAAQDRRPSFDLDPQPLDQAVLAIGRATGASIGLRDRTLARTTVQRVRGANSAAEALRKALKGTGAQARMIAPNTFLIEREPPPAKPNPPSRQPQPASPSPAAEEIIVTASKLAVPFAQYPGTATLLDGSSVSFAQGAKGTDALVERAPGLTTTHLGPGRNKLFLRGISDSSFTGPTQGTVGQYWGDTRVSYSAPDPNLRLYDIRSIEVLEGPQGTLYGAGALGGIVKVTLNPPDFERTGGSLWGGVQAVQKGAPGGDLGGHLNLPLVENKLAVRLLAYGGIDGGYIDDLGRGLKDVNQVRTVGGRALLRWQASAQWTFDLNTTYQRIRGRDAQYADRGGDDLTRSSAVAQPFTDAFLLSEFVAKGRLGDIDLVSASGFVDQRLTETFDASSGSFTRAYEQIYRVRMFSSETRLSQHHSNGSGWVVGFNALDSLTHLDRTLTSESQLTAPTTFGVRNRMSELTIFGEATVALTDWLRATAGARVTYSWLAGNEQNSRNGVDFPRGPRTVRRGFRALPSAAVMVEPFADVSLYVRCQQGYRPGGISLRGQAVAYFVSDTLTACETGLRYQPDGGRLLVTTSLAATDWRNIQADLIDPNGFPVTANIGDGRVLSIGLSGRWRPNPAWALEAAAYFNDSKVTRVAPNSNAVEVRGPLPNVANVTARIALDYSHRLDDNWRLHLNQVIRYVGRSRLGVGTRLGKLQGDYVEAALEARVATDRVGVSLSLSNLFDSRGSRFALGSPFLLVSGDQIVPIQPRAARLGLDMNF